MYAIYKYIDTRNGMIYIGQSNNAERRYKEHMKKKRNNYFDNHLQAHPEAFEFEIITNELETREQANFAERWWIDYYNCVYPNGYNMLKGGDIYEVNEETKRKQSESAKGKKKTEEHKKNLSESGKQFYKTKQGTARKKQISEEKTGRKLTEEWRQNVSESLKLFYQTEEGKKNKQEAVKKLQGKKRSEETKRKLSECKKGINNPMAKRVKCIELNIEFETMTAAAEWLRNNGHPTAQKSGISYACGKPNRTAYGYHWEYVEE